eukprot:g16974.t1
MAVVADSVLVDTVTDGNINLQETFNFDGPSSSDDALHCMYIELQTGAAVGTYDPAMEVSYTMESYTTVTYVTDMGGTISNDRYLARQDDTTVVNAGPDVASVAVSVTADYEDTDSLTLYVAHCDDTSYSNAVVVSQEFDETATYTLAFDIKGDPAEAINCWYLEFET